MEHEEGLFGKDIPYQYRNLGAAPMIADVQGGAYKYTPFQRGFLG